MFKKILAIVSFCLMMSSMSTLAHGNERIQSNNLYDLLPKGVGYEWNYQGFAEYGHTMEISNINDQKTIYNISGNIPKKRHFYLRRGLKTIYFKKRL